MTDDHQTPTKLRPSPLPPREQMAVPPGIRPSVAPPTPPVHARVEIRPTTAPPRRQEVAPPSMPTGRTLVAPPRSRDDRRPPPSAQPYSPPPRPPRREEPRRLPPDRPTLRVTVGEEVVAQIEAAAERAERGDTRGLRNAAKTGARLGIDNKYTHEELARLRRSQSAAFAGAIKSTKRALARMHAPGSVSDFDDATISLSEHLQTALSCDPKERTWGKLLHMLDTSAEELERLPLDFYMTLTAVPVKEGSIALYERIQPKRGARIGKNMPFADVIIPDLGTKQVEVIYFGGRPTSLQPTRLIAPGEPIDAPMAKIVLLQDSTFRLELGDEHYLMRHEEGVVEWVYYLLDADDNYRISEPLVRTFRDGKPHGFVDPSQTLLVMERFVARPLLAFLHETSMGRHCYLAVLMKVGNVVVYEVPWSDELAVGIKDDPILEIVVGIVPQDEPIVLDATSAVSTPEPTSTAPIAAA